MILSVKPGMSLEGMKPFLDTVWLNLQPEMKVLIAIDPKHAEGAALYRELSAQYGDRMMIYDRMEVEDAVAEVMKHWTHEAVSISGAEKVFKLENAKLRAELLKHMSAELLDFVPGRIVIVGQTKPLAGVRPIEMIEIGQYVDQLMDVYEAYVTSA